MRPSPHLINPFSCAYFQKSLCISDYVGWQVCCPPGFNFHMVHHNRHTDIPILTGDHTGYIVSFCKCCTLATNLPLSRTMMDKTRRAAVIAGYCWCRWWGGTRPTGGTCARSEGEQGRALCWNSKETQSCQQPNEYSH